MLKHFLYINLVLGTVVAHTGENSNVSVHVKWFK